MAGVGLAVSEPRLRGIVLDSKFNVTFAIGAKLHGDDCSVQYVRVCVDKRCKYRLPSWP